MDPGEMRIDWYVHLLQEAWYAQTSPVVAARITDHVWTVRELIEKTSGTH
jgi:hypothetical protein